MADGLTSVDQFTTGLVFQFPRVERYEAWQDWYDGNYGALYPEPSINNGRNLLGEHDYIEPRIFKMVSDFYKDGTIAERPAVTADSPEFTAWFEENGERFFNGVERGVSTWSIFGWSVLVTHEDGTIENVHPSAYFRIGQLYDPDESVGHVIAYRYFEHENIHDFQPNQVNYPNRVRIIKYVPSEGINTVQVFAMDGFVIGAPLTPPEPAGITALCTAGKDDGWYDDAQDVAAAFMIRLSLNQTALSRHDNRATLVPPGLLKSYSPGENMTPTEQLAAFNKLVRPVIEADPQGGDVGTIGEATAFPDEADHVEYLAQMFYLASGIPPTSFGIGIGAGESGYAREKAQDRASARIRSLRQDLTRCLAAILTGMGAPEADVTIAWFTNPFEDRTAKLDWVLRLKDAGLINDEQAAEMMDIEYRGTDTPQAENTPQDTPAG